MSNTRLDGLALRRCIGNINGQRRSAACLRIAAPLNHPWRVEAASSAASHHPGRQNVSCRRLRQHPVEQPLPAPKCGGRHDRRSRLFLRRHVHTHPANPAQRAICRHHRSSSCIATVVSRPCTPPSALRGAEPRVPALHRRRELQNGSGPVRVRQQHHSRGCPTRADAWASPKAMNPERRTSGSPQRVGLKRQIRRDEHRIAATAGGFRSERCCSAAVSRVDRSPAASFAPLPGRVRRDYRRYHVLSFNVGHESVQIGGGTLTETLV